MDHIPRFERGEILLIKKMGILAPSAPIASVAKRSNESSFQGNLSEENVASLDELFPTASKAMTGRATHRPPTA